MKREIIEKMKALYSEIKNLKLVGSELGMPWQTVYWHLKKEGVEVVGDKNRYGGLSDQVALIGERLFRKTFPNAIDKNSQKFQAKYDFEIGELRVDVKTSFIRRVKTRAGNYIERWAFSNNGQDEADFIVCYCLTGDLENTNVEHILLIPLEFIKGKQSVSVSRNKSKWYDFKVKEGELKEFLNSF